MLALLLREKPARLFLSLKNTDRPWYISNLARATGASFVYLSRFLPKLEAAGLVRMEKKGNKRLVVLSEKGTELAQLLDEIKRRLDTTAGEPKPPAASASA